MRKGWNLRACALLLGAATWLCCASGCDKKDDVITEDEMPYGATMTVNKTDYVIPVQYDTRFLPAEMLGTVLNFYYAIEKKDTALFQSLQLPLYHDYELNDVLEGKFTDEQLLTNSYDSVKEFYGKDFEFSFIDIADAIVGDENSTSATLLELLDSLSEEKDGSKISKDIDKFYELTITRFLADAGSGHKGETGKYLTGEKLFVLRCQQKWYVIYT